MAMQNTKLYGNEEYIFITGCSANLFLTAASLGICVKLSSAFVGSNPMLTGLSQAKYNHHLNVPNSRPTG